VASVNSIGWNAVQSYPGREQSTGENVGHDYGQDVGWALEHNAAPRVDYHCPQSAPTPSAVLCGAALLIGLLGKRRITR